MVGNFDRNNSNMTKFTIHTLESVPAGSKAIIEKTVAQYKSVPGLYGVLAEAPPALKAYLELHQLFLESSLTNEEKTVVWQTINVEHNCTYCVPAHTALASFMKVDPALNEALRNDADMPTEKLQVLKDFTLSMVRERGNVTTELLTAFFDAGYSQQNVLEIILGLSQKVISNYTNHVAHTPVDPIFQQFAWQKK
jgi:alkylhydroperoxidase family enzyme